jgi:soluble lytic murein transglycosylase-like protein
VIPPQGVAVSASATTTSTSTSTGDGDEPDCDSDDPGDGDGDADDCAGGAPEATTSTAAPVSTASSAGTYTVAPGDTLTGVAARLGLSPSALAAANGLSSTSFLIAGSVIHTSGIASSVASTTVPVSATTTTLPQTSTQPVGAAAQGSPTAPPYPTPESMSAGQIGSIASTQGVSSSLADAIAWQESGFNNDLVSSADARGIMQITPGTWAWIQHSLDTGTPLAPASATDNVRGGSIMLNWLLNQTGGDPAMAAAGYYQGLSSVRANGMYSDTQQYVQSVMALRHRFGG